MKDFKGCTGYTLISKEELKDINSIGYVLCHDKTGARVVCISNDDDNKGFMVGFNTPQDNSTGVPHILEHSVLCGSKKYPVKDAITEVGKGSLNTFLNAFTYPDRTVYPVASCNNKDFDNLMGVYLDACFFPRVYDEPNIFKQEGWHYELFQEDGELTINGVVYNEMKGVYSSPEQSCNQNLMLTLFPDTQYGVVSGGDPDCIPNLSYEDFVSFHKTLYHPSNSRIFLYGDMDIAEKLTYIDKEYLSKFDYLKVNSEIKYQKPFEKAKRIVMEYPVSDNADVNKTFLTYNVVCSDYTDTLTTEAMDIINYALCSVPGAKLKQRLIDAGIGTDVYSEYETDTCQKFFSIIAQDANPKDEKRFIEIIEDTIREIIAEGFDRKTIEAAITSNEFNYREADYGYYPKGIAYGLMTMDEWAYSDDNIFANLKQSEVFKKLRKGLNEGLFENVLKERVLNNPHKVIFIYNPKKGLAREKEDALKEKLAKIKAGLSKTELKKLIADTKALKLYQETPDSEEALATIPSLKLSDIDKEIKHLEYSVSEVAGAKVVFTKQPSNGIVYFSIVFDLNSLPVELYPALSVLKGLYGSVNTANYKYGDLVNEFNIKTGGVTATAETYTTVDNLDECNLTFEVKGRAFYENIKDVFALIAEVLFTSDITDKKRIKELLQQGKTRSQGNMISSGHAVAVSRAKSYLSNAAKVSEILSGVDFYRYIEKLNGNFDEMYDALVSDMKKVTDYILNSYNMEVLVGAEETGFKQFTGELENFIKKFKNEKRTNISQKVAAVRMQEGFTSSSQVQYACLSGNFIKHNLPYVGALSCMRSILSTEYLWNNVRILGGAYGCMCDFNRFGNGFFVSYRDPKLKETYEVYKNASKFLKEYPDDADVIERYIISTIGEIDAPVSPSVNTSRAYIYYKCHVTAQMLDKSRKELLNTTVEDIHGLSKYIDAIVEDNCVCTVGGEEILKKEGDMFDIITPLFEA